MFCNLTLASRIFEIKSVITPVKSQIEREPHINAKIDFSSIKYNNVPPKKVTADRNIIFFIKFLSVYFFQFKNGAIAIKNTTGAIIGAKVAL